MSKTSRLLLDSKGSVGAAVYPEGVARRIEFIASEPFTYGEWTLEDYAFHLEGLTEGEMEVWLDELISEGDSHLDGLM